MKKNTLESKSLWKAFPAADKSELLTVSDITLSVKKGEFVCIVGPSGCGKTTILQMLGGLVSPTKGDVYFEGASLTKPTSEIGMVFQKPNLMPWRTVLENVMLPLQIRGLPISKQKQDARDILRTVGLDDFADHYPKTLSGGMEQRVVLARALVTHPEILLLDEPFAALDSLTREKLNLELLRLWRERHLTAVMVTHNIREAVFFSDRVLVLSPRPATIAKEFIIDLPRPRDEKIEYTSTFVDLSYKIRKSIKA